MTSVSVVLPCYRTGAVLGELHERLRDALRRHDPVEFLFVDDACPEGGGALIDALAARDPHVVALHHPFNRGQHETVFTGLRVARGEVTVVMDADLQDPPEAAPLLIDALHGSMVDAVFAGRRGRYESTGRLATSRLFKSTISRLTGLPSDAGGFVAMRRPLVDEVVAAAGRRPYLLAAIGATGRPVLSVPVERAARPVGESATTSLVRLRTGVGALVDLTLRRFR